MAKKALTEHIDGRELLKNPLEAEYRAFRKMLPKLLKRYEGERVAIYKGKVVEHHKDFSELGRKTFEKYGIDLKFNGFDINWIDCVATERKNVLLGRNVLNRFFITLDGSNLTFDMKQE
jgi:hypothetical protein